MNRNIMELHYDFSSPQKIVFGWGRRREIGTLAATLGRRAVIVAGRLGKLGGPLTAELSNAMRAQGIDVVITEPIAQEPEVADVDRLVDQIRRQGVRPGDFILAIGGGAAMDSAKAAAAMVVDPQDASVRDYLEGVGRGLKITRPPLAVLALPTTAGSGAEATYNAVISGCDPPFKKSLRDPRILPRIALVDPELTVSVPPAVTAASGMDAVTQLIESYLTRRARADLAGVRRGRAEIGDWVAGRSGRAGRLAPGEGVHGPGGPDVGHGAGQLGARHGPRSGRGLGHPCPRAARPGLRRHAAGGLADQSPGLRSGPGGTPRLVFGLGAETPAGVAAQLLIDRIESLCRQVGVPERLGALGVRPEQVPALVQGSRGASMSGNPRELSDAELTQILEDAL